MRRVVVTGGRGFGVVDWRAPREDVPRLRRIADFQAFILRETLDEMHTTEPFERVDEGGGDGADMLARRWRAAHGVPGKTHKAEWRRYGRAAGPIRNGEMLYRVQPDAVIAFPGGDGTADCVRQAHTMGFEVIEIEVPTHVR